MAAAPLALRQSAGATRYEANWESIDSRPSPSGTWTPSSASSSIGGFTRCHHLRRHAPRARRRTRSGYWHSLTEGKKATGAGSRWLPDPASFTSAYTGRFSVLRFRATVSRRDVRPGPLGGRIRPLRRPLRCAHFETPRGLRVVAQPRRLIAPGDDPGTRWTSARGATCSAISPRQGASAACTWAFTIRSTSGINPLWLSDKPRYVREHLFPQFQDGGESRGAGESVSPTAEWD